MTRLELRPAPDDVMWWHENGYGTNHDTDVTQFIRVPARQGIAR